MVNKAWDVLSDASKRRTYDNFGADAAEGRPGGNPFEGFGGGFPGGAGFHGFPEEIFRQFARGGGAGRAGQGPGGGGFQGGMPGGFNINLSNPAALVTLLPLLLMVSALFCCVLTSCLSITSAETKSRCTIEQILFFNHIVHYRDFNSS